MKIRTSSVSIYHQPLRYFHVNVLFEHSSHVRIWYDVYPLRSNQHFFLFGATVPPPQWARASSFTRFLDHTQRRTTFGRTPLDEWSARRRNLYLTILTTDRHPCPWRDSNPQSQQANGHWGRPLINIGTQKLVGLLWTSDQPVAETSTWQHTTLTTDRHPCCWRDSNPQSQQASGHWDRPLINIGTQKYIMLLW